MGMSIEESARLLYQAQQDSMRKMLEAWDRELEAQAEAFREAAKKKAAADNAQALDAAALEVYLEGLISQAKAGADVSVSIPAGIRVASSIATAPSVAELESLLDGIDDAEAQHALASQRSAAWALGHGFMPHPGDLSDLMRAGQVDAPFAERLTDIAGQLSKLEGPAVRHPKLELLAAHDRVFALKDQVSVMKAYGSDRTLALVKDPRALGKSLERPVPGAVTGRGPKMGHEALGRVLDGLFSAKK